MAAEDAVSFPTLATFENYHFNSLFEELSNLMNLWSFCRNRYDRVHFWYKMNYNFITSRLGNINMHVARRIIEVKVSVDRCMLLIDQQGCWLSQRMNHLGAYFFVESLKPYLPDVLEETRNVQVSMKNLVSKYYELEKDLDSLSFDLIRADVEATYTKNFISQTNDAEKSSNLFSTSEVCLNSEPIGNTTLDELSQFQKGFSF